MKVDKSSFLNILVFLTFCISIAFVSRTNCQSRSSVQGSLELSHSLVGQSCHGEKLTFLVRLTNISKTKVNIDNRFLTRYKSAFYFPESKSPHGRTALGDSFPERVVPEEYVVSLLPGTFAEQSYSIDPAKDVFFLEAGLYRIDVGYGQFRRYSARGNKMFVGAVNAPPLEFRIVDCPQ